MKVMLVVKDSKTKSPKKTTVVDLAGQEGYVEVCDVELLDDKGEVVEKKGLFVGLHLRHGRIQLTSPS